MVRRLTAAGLVLLMPLVAFSAPLMHVHADDHDDSPHHHRRAMHAHLHGHATTTPAPGPQIDHDETERTMAAQLFVAVAADEPGPAVAASPVFTLLVAQEIAVGRAPQVSHGHDPPVAAVLGPRPPPAF